MLVRLPDPFTPGAAAANAATPTCCCCCCCCAVSSVGALVALPAGLAHDVRPRRVATVAILPAAVFPLLVLISPFVARTLDHLPWFVGIGLPLALVWAIVAGRLTRSPRPFTGALRLVLWASLFAIELFLGYFVVLFAAALSYFGLLIVFGYLVLVGCTGKWVFEYYAKDPE